MGSTLHPAAADQPPPESPGGSHTVQICDKLVLYSRAEQDARERGGAPYPGRIDGRVAIGHAACSHAHPACKREAWRIERDGYRTFGHCAVIEQMSHAQDATAATAAWHIQPEAPRR